MLRSSAGTADPRDDLCDDQKGQVDGKRKDSGSHLALTPVMEDSLQDTDSLEAEFIRVILTAINE